MVTIGSLWLAILISAALVFVASSIVWMVLPHHKSEFKPVPNEEGARAALANLSPGLYNIPHMEKRSDMETPEGRKKFEEGPIALLTVLSRGVPQMGKQMVQWFVFCVITSVVVAYVTGRSLAPGAEYLSVFRLAGTTAWLAYGWAGLSESIWFGRPWSSSLKHLGDALLYGLLTAGVFGWLWPA